MSIDSLDEKLIHLLQEDAQESSETLAKELGVSSTTIRRRIKRLTEEGIIRIAALTDPVKVGVPLLAIIAFDVAHDHLESTVKMLSNQPEVKWASITTGRFDILVMTAFQSTEELSQFVQKKISTLAGVKDTETFVCLRVEKGRYIQM